MEGCEKAMKRYAFKCLTCKMISMKIGDNKEDGEDIVVCKSCLLGCHHGHEGTWKKADFQTQTLTCECRIKYPICLFKK